MANYIAWYGKKRARLQVREREFEKLLRETIDQTLLEEGAEAVRIAHIRALKAVRAQFGPSERNAAALCKLDEEIRFWLSLTVAEVVKGYQSGTLRGVGNAFSWRAKAQANASANTSADPH